MAQRLDERHCDELLIDRLALGGRGARSAYDDTHCRSATEPWHSRPPDGEAEAGTCESEGARTPSGYAIVVISRFRQRLEPARELRNVLRRHRCSGPVSVDTPRLVPHE